MCLALQAARAACRSGKEAALLGGLALFQFGLFGRTERLAELSVEGGALVRGRYPRVLYERRLDDGCAFEEQPLR